MGTEELWLRAGLASLGQEEPGEDEAMLLIAGYLDGSLDEAGRDRVEAWLAADPAALETMLACRADLAASEDLEAVPAGLLDRAQGLVRERPAPAAPAGRSWIDRLTGGFGGVLQPVGFAAVVLLAVLAGAELAQSSFANLTALELAQAESELGLAGDDLF